MDGEHLEHLRSVIPTVVVVDEDGVGVPQTRDNPQISAQPALSLRIETTMHVRKV